MARPPQAEISLYRGALRDVNTLAQRDLLTHWRQFDLRDATKVRDGLMDVLPGIITAHHLSAATVAADWYDLQRHNLGAKRRFQAVMAAPPTHARGAIMARWGVSPMFSGTGPDLAAGLVLTKVSGGLQRVVANAARQSIVESVAKDPARVGWVRVGNGECDWCQQYLDGEVHYVEGYDFEAHDHCQCDAVIDVG